MSDNAGKPVQLSVIPAPALWGAPVPAAAAPTAAAAAPPMPLLDIEAAAPPASAQSVEPMPEVLREKLKEFELWAKRNEREARNDTIAFWALKIPAILVSAGAGFIHSVGNPNLALITGMVAGALVLVDGLRPRGQLRNVHRLAFYQLREFENKATTLWTVGRLEAKEPKMLTAQILRLAQNELERISRYIRQAEELRETGGREGSASHEKTAGGDS